MKPGTTLIDIGAFIGDTAAYFAMNSNVKTIMAYEPHPSTFGILQDNVNELPEILKEKIRLKNKAIMEKEGYVANSSSSVTGSNKVRKIAEGGGSMYFMRQRCQRSLKTSKR